MRSVWTWATLPAIVLSTQGGSAANVELRDYVVPKDGITCDIIAAKEIAGPAPAATKLEILHHYNPQLGALPHKLKAGQILKLPKAGAPDAKVSAVHKTVEAATPTPHPATKNEGLFRGHKVSTLAESSAEVSFADETRLQLAEHTLVVILGGTSSKAAAGKTDTTLMKGTLHGFLSGLGPKVAPAPIATPSAKVIGTSGSEIKLHVDDKQKTTLSVYKGTTQFSAAGKTVAVNAGFGSQAVVGKPPTPPRRLPTAPEWQTALPVLALSLAADVAVSATYAAGKGDGPPAVKWHVQLARDARFNDLVTDVEVPAHVVKLDAQKLVAGEYFARVAAIDAEKFHGPFSPTSSLRVATVKVARGSAGKLATADVGADLHCALDGGALAKVTGPLVLPPAQAHTVRCALDATTQPLEVAIGAEAVGPVLVQSELGPIALTADGAKRVITLRPTDAAGVLIAKPKLEVTADEGVTVGAAVPRADGAFAFEVSWRRGAKPAKLHWVVNAVERDDVAVDNVDPPLPPAPPPPKRSGPRFDLGVLGVAAGGLHALGLGYGGGIEATVSYGVGGGAVFGGVRGALEQYRSGDSQQAATHSYKIDADLLTAGIPLGYRLFGGPKARWTPYALVLPQVIFVKSTKFDEIVAETTERSTRFGLAGSLGLQFDFGKLGAFVEGGYRLAQAHDRAMGTTALSGPMGALGLRWRF